MAQINEISNLLRKLAPGRLTNLAEQYPSIAREMEGFWAGPTPKDVELVRARFAIDVMDEVRLKCDAAIRMARDKIRKGRVINLVSQIFSIVGGGTIIGCLGLHRPQAALVTAVVTLISSIGSAISTFMTAVPGDRSKRDMITVYGELCDAQLSLKNKSFELSMLVSGGSKQDLERCVGQANELCQKINKTISSLLL